MNPRDGKEPRRVILVTEEPDLGRRIQELLDTAGVKPAVEVVSAASLREAREHVERVGTDRLPRDASRGGELAPRKEEIGLWPILEGLPIAALVHDAAGSVLAANEAAIRMSGLAQEEFLGKRRFGLGSLIPEAGWSFRNLEPGESARWEGDLRGPDGTSFLAEVTAGCFERAGERLFVTTTREVNYRTLLAEEVTRWRGECERLAAERGLILEMANDMIYRHDTKGVFTYVSPAIERISGYGRKDWEKHYTTYLTDNPINRKVIDSTESALRTGRQMPPYHVEIRHRDGHPVLLEVNERPYFEEGKVAGLIGIARDVTEMVKTREALRASEENFRMLLELNPDGILLADPMTRRIAYANPAVASLFGYASDEMNRLHVDDMHPKEELPKALEFFHAIVRKEMTVAPRLACKRKDGAIFFADITCYHVPWEGESLLAGCFRDVTEEVRTQEEKRLSEEKYRALFVSSRDAILLLTLDPVSGRPERFVDCNPAALEMFGHSHSEFLRLAPLASSPPLQPDGRDSTERIGEHARRVLEEGSASFEWLCRKKNGEALLVHALFSRLGGNRVQATLRDITEQRRLEEERLRAQKLESLGILAGGIAHDLNNLLAIMTAGVAVLKSAGEGADGRGGEVYLDVEGAIAQAKGIAGQLLAFTRGGAPIMEVGSLSDVLRESATLALRGTSARCSFDLPASLRLACFDRTQIGQVACNLVINAQQAMPEGGTVTVSAENVPDPSGVHGLPRTGVFVKFSVRDEGAGIPKELLGRVFEPYFTTKPNGRGLGLATAYQIVARHGGLIRVSSEPGRGAVFDVYLPAAGAGEVSKAPPDALDAGAEEAGAGPRRKILIMDDEAGFRRSVGRMIARLGYDVTLTNDGAEAIETYDKASLAGEPFDAVIMDLTVPGGMGGKKAIGILLGRHPKAKVIVASGYSDDPVLAEYRRYGFCGVLRKPFDTADFRAMMSRIFPAG